MKGHSQNFFGVKGEEDDNYSGVPHREVGVHEVREWREVRVYIPTIEEQMWAEKERSEKDKFCVSIPAEFKPRLLEMINHNRKRRMGEFYVIRNLTCPLCEKYYNGVSCGECPLVGLEVRGREFEFGCIILAKEMLKKLRIETVLDISVERISWRDIWDWHACRELDMLRDVANRRLWINWV